MADPNVTDLGYTKVFGQQHIATLDISMKHLLQAACYASLNRFAAIMQNAHHGFSTGCSMLPLAGKATAVNMSLAADSLLHHNSAMHAVVRYKRVMLQSIMLTVQAHSCLTL